MKEKKLLEPKIFSKREIQREKLLKDLKKKRLLNLKKF